MEFSVHMRKFRNFQENMLLKVPKSSGILKKVRVPEQDFEKCGVPEQELFGTLEKVGVPEQERSGTATVPELLGT